MALDIYDSFVLNHCYFTRRQYLCIRRISPSPQIILPCASHTYCMLLMRQPGVTMPTIRNSILLLEVVRSIRLPLFSKKCHSFLVNKCALHFVGNQCIRLWSYDMMRHRFYSFCLQFMCGNIGVTEWKSVATLVQSAVKLVLIASKNKPAFDYIYGLMAKRRQLLSEPGIPCLQPHLWIKRLG